MDSRVKIFKIKKDSIETLKKWGLSLSNELLEEAVNSLDEENCIFEEVRLFYINDIPYVVFVMLSKPNKNLIKGTESDINKKHREITKQATIEEVKTELLYRILNSNF